MRVSDLIIGAIDCATGKLGARDRNGAEHRARVGQGRNASTFISPQLDMLPPPRHPSPLASPDSLASSVPFPSSAEAARMPPPPPPVPTKQSTLLPVEPLPDSLLLRSTFSALDHSAHHLKKLSKAVLAASATVLSLYSQLEAAEDEMFSSLGDLASFLDIGNGRIGTGIEDGVFGELGVKSWKRAERRREREAMDKLVVETVTKLKGDVKAHALGLAGSQGAQARFDVSAELCTRLRLTKPANCKTILFVDISVPCSCTCFLFIVSTYNYGIGSTA